MIEANQAVAIQAGRDPRESRTAAPENQAPFSLALASATLQNQAAISLEVHGAAPSNTAAANGFNTQTSNGADETTTQQPTQSQQSSKTETPNASPEASRKASPSLQSPAPSTPVGTQPQQTAQQSFLQTPVALAAVTTSAQQAATQQTSPRENAAVREATTLKNTARTEKPAPAARTSEPQAARQDFARLLAQRLDKATSFDIRLDPPELGRVEGRFTVGDDGKTVLALKFDNQTALDLFAKDEAALRTVLGDTGFDLTNNAFSFSLAKDGDEHATLPSLDGEPNLAISPTSYDPVFNAPFSDGAVDIRI